MNRISICFADKVIETRLTCFGCVKRVEEVGTVKEEAL